MYIGAVVRALTSSHMWVEFVVVSRLALFRGFFSGFSGFPSSA